MQRLTLFLFTITLVTLGNSASATGTAFDVLEVNGHPGYLTAYEVSPDGILDKVMLIVVGFDTSNDSHPIDDINSEYQAVIDELQPDGWDFVIFDYVRGDIDINKNSENLAHFIGLLDTVTVPDYHLAIVGGSMGGIVTRNMFVQEDSNMGVDTFVSLDSPHHGVTPSPWVEDLAQIFINFEAAYQMTNGSPEYNQLYGNMESVESSPGWMESRIDPMATMAIALSDGETYWSESWWDLLVHTNFHSISSFVEAEGLTSDYMPYHSVCMFDDLSFNLWVGWFENFYWYNSTATSYFDAKQPNPKTIHGAPTFAVQQAVDFIVTYAP